MFVGAVCVSVVIYSYFLCCFVFFFFILVFYFFFFFFFFSSRRRHTRWNCDWSSDVCSSDLPGRETGSRPRRTAHAAPRGAAAPRRPARARGSAWRRGSPRSAAACDAWTHAVRAGRVWGRRACRASCRAVSVHGTAHASGRGRANPAGRWARSPRVGLAAIACGEPPEEGPPLLLHPHDQLRVLALGAGDEAHVRDPAAVREVEQRVDARALRAAVEVDDLRLAIPEHDLGEIDLHAAHDFHVQLLAAIVDRKGDVAPVVVAAQRLTVFPHESLTRGQHDDTRRPDDRRQEHARRDHDARTTAHDHGRPRAAQREAAAHDDDRAMRMIAHDDDAAREGG